MYLCWGSHLCANDPVRWMFVVAVVVCARNIISNLSSHACCVRWDLCSVLVVLACWMYSVPIMPGEMLFFAPNHSVKNSKSARVSLWHFDCSARVCINVPLLFLLFVYCSQFVRVLNVLVELMPKRCNTLIILLNSIKFRTTNRLAWLKPISAFCLFSKRSESVLY